MSDLAAISVTALCDFAARSGSLQYRYTPAPSAEEGIAGHRLLQKRRPAEYQAEYPLTGCFAGLTVRGRVDGYCLQNDERWLEEIKTHHGEEGRRESARNTLHWAQLKVYGALLCSRDNLDNIRLRLTYFDLLNDREQSEERCLSASELTQFAETLCERFRLWAEQESQHRQERDQALGALQFPFPTFRHGQRELSELCFKAISTGRSALLQAPTGLGKTLGVLYPALLSMPRQSLDRLFFLSNRNTGKQLALDAVVQLQQSQTLPLSTRFLELTAREQACEHPNLACHGESCPLANGFFDRLPAARQAAAKEDILDKNRLRDIALDSNICPYFLGQEMAHWSDVIVADVNHLFDRQAILHSLLRAKEWQAVTLIDEAHNLIDRARSMYSTTLQQQLPLALLKQAPVSLIAHLKAVIRAWQGVIRENKEQARPSEKTNYLQVTIAPPQKLITQLIRLNKAISLYMGEHRLDSEWQDLLFESLGFRALLEDFSEDSRLILTLALKRETKDIQAGHATLQIQNLIPADHLRERFAATRSTILFSATLAPAQYYRDTLGLPEHTVWRDIDSPFKKDQISLRIVSHIDTRYQQRHQSLIPVNNRIRAQYEREPGNYLVYLSSFAYLNALVDDFKTRFPGLAVIAQTPRMNSDQRATFMHTLETQRGTIAFAVLGGVFGEGIDLPGDKLVGVFVATLGLPPHDDFHRELEQRLQARFGEGYRYTYLYPGLRKVIQAAGRLIRTPEDRGIIELIDPRFAHSEVQATFPRWWQNDHLKTD